MAWDDDKGPGDGLPSSEWDAHVADQKSRPKNLVQSSEPPVGPEGQLWTKLIDVYTEDTSFVTDASGDTFITSGGLIVYADNTTNEIKAYNIDTDGPEWTYAVDGTLSAGIAVSEAANRVWAADLANDGRAYEVNLTDGSEVSTNDYEFTATAVDDITVNDNNQAFVLFNQDGNRIGRADQSGWPFTGADGSNSITAGPNALYSAGGDVNSGIVEFPIDIESSSETEINIRSVFGDIYFDDSHIYITDSPVEKMDTNGTTQWTESVSGQIRFDPDVDEVYVADGGDSVALDDSDGSEISRRVLNSSSADSVNRYNGTSYINTSDDGVSTFAAQNEYELYISDGSRWMLNNRW